MGPITTMTKTLTPSRQSSGYCRQVAATAGNLGKGAQAADSTQTIGGAQDDQSTRNIWLAKALV